VPHRIDKSANAIVIECLKKRKRGVYRAVPLPADLLIRLNDVHGLERLRCDPELNGTRIWKWSRTTAWNRVKTTMRSAGIVEGPAMPKALRHAFGVGGTHLRNERRSSTTKIARNHPPAESRYKCGRPDPGIAIRYINNAWWSVLGLPP